jgi:hypothetical protein
MSLRKITISIFTSVALIIGAYLAFLIFISWPLDELSVRQAALLGDSFGIVNSLFSGLAFAGLIVTIFLQRQELNESREVFKSQKFEDSFYRLLDFYKDNLNEISVHDNKANAYHKGVGGLAFQLRKISPFIHSYSKKQTGRGSNNSFDFTGLQKSLIPQSRYLGTLESILYLIMNNLNNSERAFYLKIFSSQLTVHEVKYIFYRCLVSKTDDPLVELVNESRIIERRISEMGINRKIIDLYNECHGVEFKVHQNK